MDIKKKKYNDLKMLNLLKSNSILFFCEQSYKKAGFQLKTTKDLWVSNYVLHNISSKLLHILLKKTIYKYMFAFFTSNLIILKPLPNNKIKLKLKNTYLIKLNNNLYLPYQLKKLTSLCYSTNSNKLISTLLLNNKLLSIVLKKTTEKVSE